MDKAEEAAELRRAGVGVKRIAAQLGVSHHRVQVWLRDVPLPSAVARPRAKDGARETAVVLRSEGRTYDEIATELGVSKGTLSLWLRDLPEADQAVELGEEGVRDAARRLRSDGLLLREIADELGVSSRSAHEWTRDLPIPARAVHGRSAEECRRMTRERWDVELERRDVDRQRVTAEAAETVGPVTARELELVAVTAYWCEGAKSKPWRRSEKVSFINSDPDLIRIWIRWLAERGIGSERLRLRLSIHESADIEAATTFWAGVVGVPTTHFSRPTLKRHNPLTVRKNTGDAYVGCLVVTVLQGREVYQHLAGVWTGLVSGTQWAAPPLPGAAHWGGIPNE
jgi:transposase